MKLNSKFKKRLGKTSLFRSIYYNYREIFNSYPYRKYMNKNKCIFIHIPKAAGSSVLNMLGHTGSRDHCTYREFRSANNYKYMSYYKFTIVRHPVSRVISLYQYFKADGNNSLKDKEFIEKYDLRNIDFENFCRLIENSRLNEINPMFWPQSKFIFDEKCELVVDDVFRMEDERWKSDLERKLNTKIGIKKVNESRKVNINITTEAKAIINRVYTIDMKLLDYN